MPRRPGGAALRLGLFLLLGAGLLVPELLRRRNLEAHRKQAAAEAAAATLPPPDADADESLDVLPDVTAELGVQFQHVVGPLGTYFTPEINGAGGALFDADNDGDLDLFLRNSGRSPEASGEFPAGADPSNRLFLQQPEGTFLDATEASGLAQAGYGGGVAAGDIDNDGDEDLFCPNYGGARLFLNDGQGRFSDATLPAGMPERDSEWGSCAAFLDYDRDGWLDVFVSHYVGDRFYGHSIACGFRKDLATYCGPLKFEPTVDRLWRNEGVKDVDGRPVVQLRDVTREAGLEAGPTNGFAVIAADFNRDGRCDVFVASDEAPNRLWINQQNGTFVDEASQRGCAFSSGGMRRANMGVAIGDVDGNLEPDLVVTTLVGEPRVAYLNHGGMFIDTAAEIGLSESGKAHTGWGAALVDVDHDGDVDLLAANGLVTPRGTNFAPHGEDSFQIVRTTVADPAAYWREYHDANQLYLNDGEGVLREARTLGGGFVRQAGSARALIVGDLDSDGDVDLVVTNNGEQARVFRNDIPKRGSWLRLRAYDPRRKRTAIGAEVLVTAGARRWLRIVQPASSYLASHDAYCHFGLGGAPQIDSIDVLWPDGLLERFSGGALNLSRTLERGSGAPVPSSDESATGATDEQR